MRLGKGGVKGKRVIYFEMYVWMTYWCMELYIGRVERVRIWY